MSFTYSTTLSTTQDKLRFLISDTEATSFVFQDEELAGLLMMETNVFFAAALALRQRMASFVTKAIKYRVGATGGTAALEIDRTSIIKSFETLIKSYEARALSELDEVFDRLAFDVDPYGRDVSEYQGYLYTDEGI